MFTKESLRTAFETLSDLGGWNDILVAGGKDCDEEYPHFKTHEDMIDTISSNESLLNYINENAQDSLPCFDISSDSIKSYITKEKVFEIGAYNATADMLYMHVFYSTYITESGKVIVCREDTYTQDAKPQRPQVEEQQDLTKRLEEDWQKFLADKTACVYRCQCKPRNIDCSKLIDYFEEFTRIYDY